MPDDPYDPYQQDSSSEPSLPGGGAPSLPAPVWAYLFSLVGDMEDDRPPRVSFLQTRRGDREYVCSLSPDHGTVTILVAPRQDLVEARDRRARDADARLRGAVPKPGGRPSAESVAPGASAEGEAAPEEEEVEPARRFSFDIREIRRIPEFYGWALEKLSTAMVEAYILTEEEPPGGSPARAADAAGSPPFVGTATTGGSPATPAASHGTPATPAGREGAPWAPKAEPPSPEAIRELAGAPEGEEPEASPPAPKLYAESPKPRAKPGGKAQSPGGKRKG